MPHYRLYFMSAHNGHIDRVNDIQASNDKAAFEIAQPSSGSAPLELWEGLRKVHRFETCQTDFSTRLQAPPTFPLQESGFVEAEAAE
jgi:hypothetical protein